MDADLGEFRQQRLELLPDPAAEVFAGGVFQAWNIVQIIVVELLVDRLEDRLDFREVADPAGMRIDLAFDVDGDTERVAVQAPAFVAFGDVGQAMGGFEGEFFEEFHCSALWIGVIGQPEWGRHGSRFARRTRSAPTGRSFT